MDGRENDAPTTATIPAVTEPAVDLTAATGSAESLPAAIVGQSLGQYLRAWL